MRLGGLARSHSPITAAFQRFVVRLVAVTAFAALWPDRSTVRSATALLCLIMGIACFLASVALREPIRISRPNRWHESVALLCLAVVIFYCF